MSGPLAHVGPNVPQDLLRATGRHVGPLRFDPDRPTPRADQWMDWHHTTYGPAVRNAFWGLIRTPAEQRDAQAIDQSARNTGEVMRMLDAHLASHRYVAGDAFSMGDIPMGVGTWRWYALPIERPALPNVQRWFDLLAQRDAFRKAVMHPLT